MLEIDGSILEGGGQILRISIALSAILGKPVSIHKIRAGRSKPGLAAQHLTGIQVVGELCQAQVEGCQLRSCALKFKPGPILCKPVLKADIGTAGGVTLLAQVALPCSLFNTDSVEFDFKGGTNADFAPQYQYLSDVAMPIFGQFGANFQCELLKSGFYPKGGGRIRLRTNPLAENQALKPLVLTEPGKPTKVTISSQCAGVLDIKIAESMADSAKAVIRSKLNPNVEVVTNVEKLGADEAFGNGSCISIKVETSTGCILGGGAIGSPKKSPQEVGKQAAKQVISALQRGACVDDFMQDQIIIFMALAEGQSRVVTGPLTMHTKTAIHMTQTLTGTEFIVSENPNGNFTICCNQGLALKRST